MGKRVLVVDDSLYMRMLIKETLSNAGYEIVGMAANGESAIDMARELSPEIITLDNILPDMMGLDVLKAIKQDQHPAKVVLISAVGQQSVVDEAHKLGALDYIVKPFTKDQLIEVVNKMA
jgi:two-component system, chemotaxis family, chemotaxis protein CheY